MEGKNKKWKLDGRKDKEILSVVERNTSKRKGGTEKVKGYKGQDKGGVGGGGREKRRVKKKRW